ncbi:MAG: three-Cys-motif partner protein TcmP [Cyanobacteriota bacterium]|nr:three-Cys-motif partner protein TcmP [Cyanobacteriota bacterium]
MSRLGRDGEDIIGQWSEEKLNLLAKYLKAYSVIMNKQKKRWLEAYYYIDAFAGSVRPIAKDEQRYIEGSPLRALQTEPSFDRYWFIDVAPRRIERLEKLREEFPNRAIEIFRGNCNEVLCKQIVSQIPYSSKKRAFVFLDPYGLQINWETVKKLANTKTCDIFVNFSVMGVTRLLPRKREPETEAVEKINKVMGSADWITQVYKPPQYTQLNLFEAQEEDSLSRDTIQGEALAYFYTKQLRSLFPYASKPVLMRNSTNSVLYALCLASHNKTAVNITNDIFKRYEWLDNR